jgi:hypothetical protein
VDHLQVGKGARKSGISGCFVTNAMAEPSAVHLTCLMKADQTLTLENQAQNWPRT